MTDSTLICDPTIISAYDDYWDNLTEAIIKADDLNGDAVITDATVELDADSGSVRVLEYTYAVP
jgi:hypothetical protein